jgi:hypothetical protein
MPVRKLLPATAAKPPPSGLGKLAAQIPFDKNAPFRFHKIMTPKIAAKIAVGAVHAARKAWFGFFRPKMF